MNLSIVIPSKNESKSLAVLLPKLKQYFPTAQIIVVNDGSTDDTDKICNENKTELITHAYNLGNGAAIKTGARNAKHDVIAFMDGDGQHSPEDLQKLLSEYEKGFDMVVGG